MNPLTLVKRIQNINSKEASLGISEQASWHAIYKESAYIYVGGIPFDLTEGDLLAVFAQYGEIVDVNLVRDKGTGKSKGYSFVAYEDQRSTILAVDNLNGAQILGRIIRVDHVSNYKKKEEEDEEIEQQKREERGVCRAFQRGECTRGAGCKFSHNEQRAANTGWGAEDHRRTRRVDDKFEGSGRIEKKPGQLDRAPYSAGKDGLRLTDKEMKESKVQVNERGIEGHRKRVGSNSRDQDDRGIEKRLERQEREKDHGHRKRVGSNSRDQDDRGIEKRLERQEREKDHKDSRDRQAFEERSKRRDFESDPRENGHRGEEKGSRKNESEDNRDRQAFEERSKRRDFQSDPRENDHRREEKGARKHESESYYIEDRENRGKDKRPVHDRDSSPCYRGTDEDRSQRSHR